MHEHIVPVPYPGGKSDVACVVWELLKECRSYIEPFCGTAAVFMARPKKLQFETLNDADGFVVNFLRACKHAPEAVAEVAMLPRAELDLCAVGKWLCDQHLSERLRADPFCYDAQVAGFWAWYVSTAITPQVRAAHKQMPRAIRQGVLGNRNSERLPEILQTIAGLLADARILCGDWQACLGASNHQDTWKTDPVGVFLDPPYRGFEHYNEGHVNIAADVEAWCRENGEDPAWRVVLCGYSGDYNLPGWSTFNWQTRGRVSKSKYEMLWISPSIANTFQ